MKINISITEIMQMLDKYDIDDFYQIYIMLPDEVKDELLTYFKYRMKNGHNIT